MALEDSLFIETRRLRVHYRRSGQGPQTLVFLRGNRLISGEHVIAGRPVDLANIRAALLNIVAQYDHLVAQSQSESIMELVSR